MDFFQRKWTDAEKWAMGIVSALVIAAIVGIVNYKGGTVKVTIASDIDEYGRCIDREFFVINETAADAFDIVISFDVDYFTRQGVVSLEYGDEQEELITSAMKTLLDRQPFVPVEHRTDHEQNKFVIPRLKPGEYLHIYFGGETIVEVESANRRTKLLEKGTPGLMDKPRVLTAVRKDGNIAINRVRECER